jgi:NADP-dependent 3-hydroxy acid dehydrogenase YdfG
MGGQSPPTGSPLYPTTERDATIVTGGSSEIADAAGRSLAANEFEVVLADVNEEWLESVAAEITADVTDWTSLSTVSAATFLPRR